MPPEAREALKRWLTRAPGRPTVVDTTKKTHGSTGAVTLNHDDAEVFLRNDRGTLRLVWNTSERRQERWIPPGRYRVLGYRIRRGSWFISSAGGRQRISVREGATTDINLDDQIAIGLRVNRKDGARLAVTIRGHADAGLSIYHEGRRIPLEYELMPPHAAKPSRGKLDYG